MRLIPPLTALVVSAALYAVVMEREALLGFAGATGLPADPQSDPARQSADQATVTSQGAGADAPLRAGTVSVVALRSHARQIDDAVVLRGETEAIRMVNLRAETTSTVVSQPLRKGARVTQGDVLCRLSPGTRPAALDEARARLSEARAKYPEAEARLEEAHALLREASINLRAAEKLSEGGFASQTRLASAQASERSAQAAIATAQSGLESTRAGIQSATAAVAAAEEELTRLTLRAPFGGVLESDSAEIGSLLQPGDLCATVIQLDTVRLLGYVPEADVGRVTLGAMARARLATGQTVSGTVTFISRAADPATRTFEVDVTVANDDYAIRDGQSAEIEIAAAGQKAHRLPQSALTLDNDGQLGVRIVEADSSGPVAAFRPVRVLRDEASGVWVSGLADTAEVIVVGQDFVTAGVPLAPSYRSSAHLGSEGTKDTAEDEAARVPEQDR